MDYRLKMSLVFIQKGKALELKENEAFNEIQTSLVVSYQEVIRILLREEEQSLYDSFPDSCGLLSLFLICWKTIFRQITNVPVF